MSELFADASPKRNELAAILMAVSLLAVASSWMVLKISGPMILLDWGVSLEGTLDESLSLVASYIIAQASVVIIAGKMMDRYGEKRVFWVASAMFVLGSSICAISFDLGSMITGRIMAGFGAGGMFAVCVSCVGTLFGTEHRGKMQGVMTAAYAFGSFLGISIGVWFYEELDWRYAFVFLGALGAIGGFGAWRFLPERKSVDERRIDWFVLIAMFVTLVMVMIYSQAVNEKFEIFSAKSGIFLLGIVLMGIITLLLEKRSANPVIPQRLHKYQISIIAGLFVIGFLLLSILQMIIRIYLINYDMDLPSAFYHSSEMLMLVIVGGAGPSLYCCRNITKIGLKPCVRLGCAITAIALLLSYFLMDAGVHYMQACMIILGCGLGFMVTELLVTLQNLTSVEDMGAVSSTAMGLRLVGIVSGLAIFGSVLHQTVIDDASPYIEEIQGMDSFLEILIYIFLNAGTLVDELTVDYTEAALQCMVPGIIGCVIIFLLTFFMKNVGAVEE